MKIKNLKIGTQLMLGFAAMLVFVVVLGVVSYQQKDEISLQAEIMYKHPLPVRMAIGDLQSDILSMRLGTRDLMLAKTNAERQAAIQLMELSYADAIRQFDVLKLQYLGPPTDIEEALDAFIRWKTAREENTGLALSGEIEKVKTSILPTGSVGTYRDAMMARIQKIDDFAQNKSKALYNESVKLNDTLNHNIFLLVAVIVLLSLIINYILMNNIRQPLTELTNCTVRFHDGDMSVRSSYESVNEFGALSTSFNTLAGSIQKNTELNKKATSLAALMMSEEETKKFFHTTLTTLNTLTGSQMAAVYLLDKDDKTFELYESIGLDNRAKQSFAGNLSEGEFGAVLSERKIVHISRIPEDTMFSFPVTTGTFRPREIITIPILELNKVVAVISLASLHGFSGLSLQLLQETWAMITVRINGVLAFKKVIDFSDKLDIQNKELEHQSKEMMMQADELKEYNIELELQKKQLYEANQLKSAFLSNMSHELRTPLNSVIALSGVLNRKLKDQIQEEEYNYLGIIEKNGKQLLSLINDILDLSRIEAGKEEFSYSKFPVQGLVQGILESLQPIANEKGITLTSNIGSELLPINSDSTKCHHILQNIISNAVKFTEKGSVEVSAELKDGKLYISIKDTGIGISKEDLPFIFDEFRQADGRSSRRFGGTGLGLAIAKKYTQLLNGTIEVTSQEGTGSVFVIILPERPAGYKVNDTESEIRPFNPSFSFRTSSGSKMGTGRTLLVVEDSEPQIIQLTDILKEEGYTLHIARNGKEALEAIRISIPDAMILDLMMPEVDGFEVLKTIREQKETRLLPVLILSAKHVTKEELSFLTGNHIYQLIQKGDINRNELLGHVNNMIYSEVKVLPVEAKRNSGSNPFRGKATILLIEDNVDNTTTVKALLGGKYILVSDTNGVSGLEKAKTLHPNLILLDISLPGMDGYTVLNELRKDEQLQHIPVIALTARAMSGDRERFLELGFDDYISKPIDNELFGNTIQEWLS